MPNYCADSKSNCTKNDLFAKKKLLSHHVNAPDYTSAVGTTKFALTHLPYSPDLVPQAFFPNSSFKIYIRLFRIVQRKPKGCNFIESSPNCGVGLEIVINVLKAGSIGFATATTVEAATNRVTMLFKKTDNKNFSDPTRYKRMKTHNL